MIVSTVTKLELINHVHTVCAVSMKQAKSIVEKFFAEISAGLKRDKIVKLSGFGNFVVRSKSARPGRNPRTGEMVMVTARNVVTFKTGTIFRKLVREHTDNSDKNKDEGA